MTNHPNCDRRGPPSRREALTLGTAVLGAVAGCIGGPPPTDGSRGPDDTPTDSPVTPGEGSSTETPAGDSAAAVASFDGGDALARVDASFPQRDVGDYYLGLVATDGAARAFPTDRLASADARTLLAETDYDGSAVVVFQDRRGSSHPDLELRSAGVDGRTLALDVGYPGDAATADVTPNTLVARIPAEVAVEAARAVLHPQHGGPVQVATLSAYPAPAFGSPGDLVVRNRDCEATSLSVTVTFEGDLFLGSRMDIAAASRRRVDGLFSRAGEWTVAVEAGQRRGERTWSLSSDPPGDVLVDVAGDGGVSIGRHTDGATRTGSGVCETDGYPYESPNPADNLDSPVDLWVLDRSPESHRLTVAIRDGETAVFSERFSTREGDDKARRAGLLAKKTDYTVTASDEGRGSLTETVTVDERTEKLTVRVTGSGGLAVSTG